MTSRLTRLVRPLQLRRANRLALTAVLVAVLGVTARTVAPVSTVSYTHLTLPTIYSV